MRVLAIGSPRFLKTETVRDGPLSVSEILRLTRLGCIVRMEFGRGETRVGVFRILAPTRRNGPHRKCSGFIDRGRNPASATGRRKQRDRNSLRSTQPPRPRKVYAIWRLLQPAHARPHSFRRRKVTQKQHLIETLRTNSLILLAEEASQQTSTCVRGRLPRQGSVGVVGRHCTSVCDRERADPRVVQNHGFANLIAKDAVPARCSAISNQPEDAVRVGVAMIELVFC